MTQSQQPQQVQQQHADQTRVQQEAGQAQSQQETELKKNSVSKQEDVDFAKLSDEGKEKDKRKNKRKKKTLEDEANNEAIRKGSIMFGGGLINTQA